MDAVLTAVGLFTEINRFVDVDSDVTYTEAPVSSPRGQAAVGHQQEDDGADDTVESSQTVKGEHVDGVKS